MTTSEFDLAVVIGRFQGVTRGHVGVIEAAIAKADRVLILVGSANLARDTRNPFSFEERAAQIWGALFDSGLLDGRITIAPLNDTGPFRKSEWIAQVQVSARNATTAVRPRVTLVGNQRDATSEYLTWFPEWPFTPVVDTGVNATAIRKAFFSGKIDFGKSNWSDNGVDWDTVLTPSAIDFLVKFRDRPEFAYLVGQKAAEDKYKTDWGVGPFQTVDGVVRQGGYVLMIQRGGEEGHGQWALPGGFLEAAETLLDGALREVVEETALFIPQHLILSFKQWLSDSATARKVKAPLATPGFVRDAMTTLRGYMKGRSERFSDPHRSRRARLITEAFYFELPDAHGLPPVIGSDDAQDARWTPISEVRPDNCFEDHAWIVDRMLSLNA
jgi:bifunctional NMN adenylyltransferase/nudix hydrolase